VAQCEDLASDTVSPGFTSVGGATVTFVDRAASRFGVNLGPTRCWFVFTPLSLTTVVVECGLSEQDGCRSKTVVGARRSCEQSETVAGGRMYSVVGRFDKADAARPLSKA
jgi:hypothetical protein